MTTTTRLLLAVAVAAGALPTTAQAGREYSFWITSAGGPDLALLCAGPWFRTSDCVQIGPDAVDRKQFYDAEDDLFSAVGPWSCIAFPRGRCLKGSALSSVKFCGPGQPGHADVVELEFDGLSLRSNQAESCASAAVTGVLGQTGEADDTPARDVDTYGFAGRPGEQVEISLGRDGSGGSAGAVATLRLRARDGGAIGERTGRVPLSLDATLPGPIEISVLRRPGDGDALRGSYTLEVTPRAGDSQGRQLAPSLDVEQP
jgi:hypothetical protein